MAFLRRQVKELQLELQRTREKSEIANEDNVAEAPNGRLPSVQKKVQGQRYSSNDLSKEQADSCDEDVVCIPRKTLDLLHLKERAMDVVKEGITIADATSPDMPLIYINEGFARITGYPTEFARNQNCRFLQGKDTDPKTVVDLKRAIKDGKPIIVQITVCCDVVECISCLLADILSFVRELYRIISEMEILLLIT